jgi:putative glutamine amidotransferase
VRDDYERALLAAFAARGKPVLGICRGLQLMNVAHGGTLFQDIETQRPGAVRHRDAVAYDRNLHPLDFVAGTRLAEIFEGTPNTVVSSVHHQAIKDLAPGFVVEARCPVDGMIEAIRKPGRNFMAAVQWHPEFHRHGEGTLDDRPLLEDFLAAAIEARTE